MAQSIALAVKNGSEVLEQVLIKGDLKDLSPEQRAAYYRQVCESLGLNPLTKPFEYIYLSGKLTLYERRNCTDQLRKIHGVNITRLDRDFIAGELYAVTAYASDSTGRADSAIGAVPVAGLKGEALANALMKAETKAKRRVTLSLCGLSWPDESEVGSIPDARTVVVDSHTGEILEERSPEQGSMVTSADDPMWQRWQALSGEAMSFGVNVWNLALPIDRKTLQATGIKVRAELNARQRQLATEDAARAKGKSGTASPTPPRPAVQSGRAPGEFPAPGARDSDVITTKDDPRWQDWLATERDARRADVKLDTSGVKLPITAESLLASITDLKEAIAEASDGKAEEAAF